MATQQKRKRRKRYDPGSAYAGDVRPTGILGILGSRTTMTVIFIAMALALAAGGAATFLFDVFQGDTRDNPAGFVRQGDEDENSNGPDAGPEVGTVRQYTEAPAMTIDPSKQYTATIETELGDVEIALDPATAPETVNNFVFLAQDGFYDGLIFHLVTPGFSAYAGDPSCTEDTDVCRGTGGPGYDLDEQVQGSFQEGTIGMSNGSQFFIALTESDQFATFTPFGEIVSGLDIVEQLQRGTRIDAIEIQEG